ncbi:GNAT family N-acetyltransferase [Candidatus Kaiserbacteria bacterium]|nr:GNAT family N-acetyltransferase [Candidatus Kaiserbacteria bacterium]
MDSNYVLPEYQNRGVGKFFWAAALKFLDLSKDTIVNVATFNENAIAFYAKLGFVDTGKCFTDERYRFRSDANIPQMEMILRASRVRQGGCVKVSP